MLNFKNKICSLACLALAGSQLTAAQQSRVGQPCASDADCVQGWEICQPGQSNSYGRLLNSDEEEQIEAPAAQCAHKDQFPMTTAEFVNALVVLAAITFTSLGGTSGGGIIIPIAMGLYRFDIKHAVALSNFSSPVSGTTRQFSSLGQSHPLKNGAGILCDYGLISMMLPGAVIGASLGAVVNLILPGPFIILLFIVFALLVSTVAFRNYLKLRRTEGKDCGPICPVIEKSESESNGSSSPSSKGDPEACTGSTKTLKRQGSSELSFQVAHANTCLRGSTKSEESNSISSSIEGVEPEIQTKPADCRVKSPPPQNDELKSVIAKESTNWQPKNLILHIAMMLILTVVQLMRGSSTSGSIIGIDRCSVVDWSLLVALIFFAAILTVLAAFMQMREYAFKQRIGYHFTQGDFKCTTKNAIRLPLCAVIVGFINAVTGIGPGTMIHAILLQLDLHPKVAGNTAHWLGVYIAMASTICQLIYGQIPVDYAAVINIFTVIGTLFGMWLQEELYHRTKKHQYSVLAMCVGVILILVTTCSLTITSTYDKYEQGVEVLAFHDYC